MTRKDTEGCPGVQVMMFLDLSAGGTNVSSLRKLIEVCTFIYVIFQCKRFKVCIGCYCLCGKHLWKHSKKQITSCFL